MLKIERFQCNMIRENCYVVADETSECVIIDCGAYYEEERKAIVDYISSNNLRPVKLLGTHGHLDHHFGDNTIFEHYGLKPEVHDGDAHLMATLKEQAKDMFGLDIDYDFPPVGHYLDDNEKVGFGNHSFTVMATPGHSQGSVSFYCEDEKVIFTGDTLFHGSIGRSDFEGGSMFMIINSLRMLAQLPDDVKVLPGHGQPTTIGEEVAHNPYMDR